MSAEVFLQIFPVICGFIIGACLGSFSSALIWRVPRGISWISSKNVPARSRCPSCQRELGVQDLIPIVSWVCQKGQCRKCHSKISVIYPCLEIGWGGIGAIVFSLFGVSVSSFVLLLFLLFSFVFIWVGVRQQVWSREILIILFFLGFLFLVFTGF